MTDRPPKTPDPSLEEIWGTETTIGMAEQIRMERPDVPDSQQRGLGRIRVLMLPPGIGKFIDK